MASLIDFSLAPKITGSDYLGPLQAMQLGRQARADELKTERAQQQQQARQEALKQYSGGDKAGAQKTAIAAGDFDLADHLGKADDQQRKQMAGVYDAIGRTAYGLKSIPPEQRQQVFDQHAAALQAQGVPPDLIAQARANLSDQALDGYANEAMSVLDQIKRFDEQNKPIALADGTELRRPNGDLVARNDPEAKWVPVPAGGQLVQVGANGAPVGGGPSTPPNVSQIVPAIIAQESGGIPRPGQPTQYGTAQGVGQQLPRTAMEISHKLGLPYSEELARGNSPEAIAYQTKLTEGYFQQGMEKYNGDVRKALMYYHGGPDESIWGPKTRAYADQVMARLGQGGGQPSGVINGPPKPKDAPSGYRWAGDNLQPIPGGPADASSNTKETRRTEVQYRKEFDGLPEVKSFKTARQQYQTLKALAAKPNPTAQDDIALIFGYMKTLDPTSVVREGEFATAQNAAGVPDAIRNAFNRAQNGTRLNAKQRQDMVKAAGESYLAYREAYNTTAENYRSYARDSGVNPDRVARTYTPDPGTRGSSVAVAGPVRVKTVQEAMKLKPGTRFVDPSGVARIR